MESLLDLPVWLIGILVFLLRIVDVSLGTFRTIAVVQGRMVTSVLLGFVEVFVWITVVANVIQHASNNLWLLTTYAGGFAAGNATGIYLERWLAQGRVILRIISSGGDEIAESLAPEVPRVFVFDGQHAEQQVALLYVAVRRRDAPALIAKAREIDPHLFYAVDNLRDSNLMAATPLPAPTGWRAMLKFK